MAMYLQWQYPAHLVEFPEPVEFSSMEKKYIQGQKLKKIHEKEKSTEI